MKKAISLLCLVLLTISAFSQTLRMATYNLRFDNPGDSLNAWKYRQAYVTDLIQLYDFDIFGTQEGLKHQLEDVKKNLNGYAYFGVGREDGKDQGEHSAIFYKSGKYQVVGQGNFWISPDTDKPNKGWDAACIRICTWGEFKELATGKQFFVFNVHLDHLGETARFEGVKLLLTKILEIAGKKPCILTGDFNFDDTHKGYAYLATSGFLEDAYLKTSVRFAPGDSFNGFKIRTEGNSRIDHIFVSPSLKILRYGILTNICNGRFPSDHFPVFVEIVL